MILQIIMDVNGRISEPFFWKTYSVFQKQAVGNADFQFLQTDPAMGVGFLFFCLKNSTLNAYSDFSADAVGMIR